MDLVIKVESPKLERLDLIEKLTRAGFKTVNGVCSVFVDVDLEQLGAVCIALTREELIAAPACWTGDGKLELSETYTMLIKHLAVGARYAVHASAPGIGHREWLITRMDETGVYGVLTEDTIRVLDPAETV